VEQRFSAAVRNFLSRRALAPEVLTACLFRWLWNIALMRKQRPGRQLEKMQRSVVGRLSPRESLHDIRMTTIDETGGPDG